jgi:hypothetical protein
MAISHNWSVFSAFPPTCTQVQSFLFEVVQLLGNTLRRCDLSKVRFSLFLPNLFALVEVLSLFLVEPIPGIVSLLFHLTERGGARILSV